MNCGYLTERTQEVRGVAQSVVCLIGNDIDLQLISKSGILLS